MKILLSLQHLLLPWLQLKAQVGKRGRPPHHPNPPLHVAWSCVVKTPHALSRWVFCILTLVCLELNFKTVNFPYKLNWEWPLYYFDVLLSQPSKLSTLSCAYRWTLHHPHWFFAPEAETPLSHMMSFQAPCPGARDQWPAAGVKEKTWPWMCPLVHSERQNAHVSHLPVAL